MKFFQTPLNPLILKKWNDSNYYNEAYDLLAKVIGCLLFTILADKTKNYRYILIVCIIGYVLASSVLLTPLYFPLPSNIDSIAFSIGIRYFQSFITSAIYPISYSIVMLELSRKNKNGMDYLGSQLVWLTIGGAVINILIHKNFFSDFSLITTSISFTAILSFILIFSKVRIETLADDDNEDCKSDAIKSSSHAKMYSSPNSSLLKIIFNWKFLTISIALFLSGLNHSFVHITLKSMLEHMTKGTETDPNSIAKINTLSRSLLLFLVLVFSKQIYSILGNNWVFLAGYIILLIRTFAYVMFSPCANIYAKLFIFDLIEGLGTPMLTLSVIRFASDASNIKYAATMQCVCQVANYYLPYAFIVLMKSETFSISTISMVYSVFIVLGGIIIFPIANMNQISRNKSIENPPKV